MFHSNAFVAPSALADFDGDYELLRMPMLPLCSNNCAMLTKSDIMKSLNSTNIKTPANAHTHDLD